MTDAKSKHAGPWDKGDDDMCGGPNQVSAHTSKTDLLIELLTTKVRVMSLEQVTELCFRHTKAPQVIARKHLRRMEKKALVTLASVMAPKPITLNAPLLNWRPGDGEPNFQHVAWLADKRLAAPPASTLVACASKKARAKTGGPLGSRPLRSQEITHDLMVVAVFEKLLKESPALARSWVPEDAILQEMVSEWGSFSEATIPDAVIREGGEEIAIDVVGRYSPKKLALIHEAHCKKRYQLW